VENRPPPELPDVDPDRLEGLHNGFLAATQEALHTNSDAFYRKTGQDAVEGLPALQEQLSQLRDAALDQAQDEGERRRWRRGSMPISPTCRTASTGMCRHRSSGATARSSPSGRP